MLAMKGSSKNVPATEVVLVVDATKPAPPARAYPPGMTPDTGNISRKTSPKNRSKVAPAMNVGIKSPVGTGREKDIAVASRRMSPASGRTMNTDSDRSACHRSGRLSSVLVRSPNISPNDKRVMPTGRQRTTASGNNIVHDASTADLLTAQAFQRNLNAADTEAYSAPRKPIRTASTAKATNSANEYDSGAKLVANIAWYAATQSWCTI
ncbi:unnamed protein product [Phytophthora lilii]|uniref:Unnamed protein product n=1 Tax=Phytophthora lilii TaxID=2077276 RepID=A0A9W6X2E5_9STRA|nr:unnamed protein product [Phytophthora lilii]